MFSMFFLTYACSDDILEVKPLNGYSEVDVFNDKALLDNYVAGIYKSLRTPFRDENTFTDGLSDNAYNQHGSADGQIKRYTSGEVNRDNGEGITFNQWANSYYYISQTNLFFEKVASSTIDQSNLDKLKAEVHFLRAYNYFDLFKWYGSVPLITETFDLGQESYEVGNASIDEIVNFIVSECDLAINKLPSKSNLPTGKASKEAAMALKGRVLLYAASPLYNESNNLAKWEAARDANKAVIELGTVSLTDEDNWDKMFRGEDDRKEVIFERQYTSYNDQGWGVNTWLFPNSAGGWSTTTPTQDLIDSYELVTGELPSESATYDNQDPYINRDPRFYKTILYNGAPFRDASYDPFVSKNDPGNSSLAGKDSRLSSISPHNASRTGYAFYKWSQEDKNYDAGNISPYIFFRKSEAYLNYAEAQIALGQESEARDAINEIRERMSMPDITTSGNDLIADYRNERRVEFVLEDHRFFDIRRWKIASTVLNKPKKGVDVLKLTDGSFEYDYSLNADININWDDKMYFLPIPYSEIQKSNNSLSQNSGYAN